MTSVVFQSLLLSSTYTCGYLCLPRTYFFQHKVPPDTLSFHFSIPFPTYSLFSLSFPFPLLHANHLAFFCNSLTHSFTSLQNFSISFFSFSHSLHWLVHMLPLKSSLLYLLYTSPNIILNSHFYFQQ